jgi:multiple antibiotic resistance protein
MGHIESEKLYRSWYYYDCFPFVEKKLLNLIGIDVNSFAVAGSLCYSLALEMILGIRIYRDEEASSSIVPLAFHLLLEQEQ